MRCICAEKQSRKHQDVMLIVIHRSASLDVIPVDGIDDILNRETHCLTDFLLCFRSHHAPDGMHLLVAVDEEDVTARCGGSAADLDRCPGRGTTDLLV